MIIQKYCSERLKTRYITARTIVRERKTQKVNQKVKNNGVFNRTSSIIQFDNGINYY